MPVSGLTQRRLTQRTMCLMGSMQIRRGKGTFERAMCLEVE